MKKEMKFEDAMERLEEIIGKLESGDVELEESLKLYEEGIELIQFCNKKLNETKEKIQILMRTSGGNFVKKELKRGIDELSSVHEEETDDEESESLF